MIARARHSPVMSHAPETGLANVLARPEITDALGLITHWHDRTFQFHLKGAGRAHGNIGSHLRRSFLGALGQGASSAAQSGQPCTWEPPCAFDVFGREQLRGPRGDGLPKPYVLRAWTSGPDLVVTLRIFGMALDWSLLAAEALVAGIRNILPWARVISGSGGAPEIAERSVRDFSFAASPVPVPERVTLVFQSPIDAKGSDMVAAPHSLITRLIRRVDALSRWNGVAMTDDEGRALARAAAALRYDLSALRFGHYESPNRHRQKRRDPTLGGSFTLAGDLASLWPILQIGARCHVGRHAVEGLGAFRLEGAARKV